MDESKKTKWTFGCMPLGSVLLTIAIMCIRAFQPNAQPMESWSVVSWIWMLLPALLPIVFGIAVLVAWAICKIVVELFAK